MRLLPALDDGNRLDTTTHSAEGLMILAGPHRGKIDPQNIAYLKRSQRTCADRFVLLPLERGEALGTTDQL